MKAEFAAVTLLGMIVGLASGGRQLLGQVVSRPVKTYCTAQNIQKTSASGAYGRDPMNDLTYNANVRFTYDCNPGEVTGCAVCILDLVSVSDGARGPWTNVTASTIITDKSECGSAGNADTFISTQSNLDENTYYKLEVLASPALVDSTGGDVYCPEFQEDYSTLATFYYDGAGDVNEY